MANTFSTPKLIGGASSTKPLKIKQIAAIKAKLPFSGNASLSGKALGGANPPISHVQDRFGAEVKQEETRLTGVSRKLVGAYQETPARMLPKSHAFNLRRLAGSKL